MAGEKILIANDQQPIRWTLSQAVRSWGFEPVEVTTIKQALEAIDAHEILVTLLDVQFRDGPGLDALGAIKIRKPGSAVIVVTGKLAVDDPELERYSGVQDFFGTPINLGRLQDAIRNSIGVRSFVTDLVSNGRQNTTHFGFEQIIGESSVIKETISLARRVAASNVSCVLLQGESGTGKDLFAKAIHHTSARSSKPFVTINCAAIPANLLESELFGFEKGAFTDAKFRKEGLFEQAEGGTLFLDEIGELEIGLQAKMLRVLEEGNFRRVGGLRDLPLNVRVIGASNRDLKTECEAKRFRLDLFFRLSVIQIDLPPLRHRGEDVIRLAENFITTIDAGRGEHRERKLTDEVKSVFRKYFWPGNVRELRNAVERCLVLEDSEFITMKNMPRGLMSAFYFEDNYLLGSNSETGKYVSLPAEGISLDQVEMWLIREALQRTGGNVTRASELLRVPRDRIRYRLKKGKLNGKPIQNLEQPRYEPN
jgi:DNA-binding NtrC family response regulator